MGPLKLIPVVDEGLGNSTYLLDLGEGRALVMDPELASARPPVTAWRVATPRSGLSPRVTGGNGAATGTATGPMTGAVRDQGGTLSARWRNPEEQTKCR